MSDQPAAIVARIHAGLKVLLARDVWGNYREADFRRKNLRRQYLHLLLLHPNAREARDMGTHLWMQTSYAFIALYKQRLQLPQVQRAYGVILPSNVTLPSELLGNNNNGNGAEEESQGQGGEDSSHRMNHFGHK